MAGKINFYTEGVDKPDYAGNMDSCDFMPLQKHADKPDGSGIIRNSSK